MNEIEELRAKLREEYESFVKLYGQLNKSINKRIIMKDEMGFIICASLETKTGHNQYAPADILVRSNKAVVEELRTSNPVEALAYTLSAVGRVDMGMMERITGNSEEILVSELGDAIYWNNIEECYEESSKWLSGNVYLKMVKCKGLQDGSERAERALKAIEEVQVEQIPYELLEFNLGERWIPIHYYSMFATWLFESETTVMWLSGVDKFKVDVKYMWGSPRCSREYRVSGMSRVILYGNDLLEHALENTSPYLTYGNPAKPDADAIQLANDKIEDIRRKFNEWLFTLQEDQKQVLVDTYNNMYNCYRLRTYDGSHLTLPDIDMASLATMGVNEIRGPQKDVAWRIIQENGSIVDWEVGSGKTLCIVVAAHEMKRMKIRNKPAILCLKSNIGDIVKLYRTAYPQAKILAPSEKDFEKENRKRLFHEMKNNDWDAVIMTHDQFGKIPQSPVIQKEIMEAELQDMENDLEAIREGGMLSVTRTMRKGLENRKATLNVKLQEIRKRIENMQDEDINFDDMGIDHLLVDECFPYDTLILTDRGWFSIGDIVSDRKEINVLSYCSESRTFELMPVTNWLKKPLVKKLVKITHEYGEIICTEDHKIWTIECGYVKARELTSRHTLVFTEMPELWKESNLTWSEELLQQDMYVSMLGQDSSKQAKRTDVTMSMVQDQSCNKQKEQVLQCELQDVTSKPVTPYQGTETSVWKGVPEVSSRRQEESKMLREDETQQSNEQPRNSSKNGKKSTEQNIPVKGWEWEIDRTTNETVSSTGTTRREYGMGDSDQTCVGAIPITAKSLQGGHWDSREDAVCRGGWKNAPNQEVEVSGQKENRNIGGSRVVSVEVHQRGSDAGYGVGSSEDNFVYDLTVEKNHNYFAAGILVSNCHRFKNLLFTTRHDRVAGLGNTAGSQKALNMLFAIRTLQKRFNSDLQATFLSGTPISNSLTEMYLLFKYLRPKELERQNIRNFDSWAAVFAKKTTDYEFSVTNQIIAKERFRHFIKVPELAMFYNEIADYRTNKSINIDKPEMEETLVNIPCTDDQREFVKALIMYAKTGEGDYIGRDDLMPGGPADSARMLIATNYAKKMSTDMRLINEHVYDDHPGNKISVCCGKVAESYMKFNEQRGVQLIFCDLGVPDKTKWNVYYAIREKLVEEYGIPVAEIKFIHDYNEKTRGKLFQQVNDGVVRILIGSTDKAGTGVNVQQRVVTIHDLDIPWKPAELEQRGGRGARQGNWLAKLEQDNIVYRYIYAVEQSLDTYKFTLLKNKQTFIAQMKKNELQVRSIDEGSFDEATGMNFAEYVAILSGDNTLLEKAKIDKKLALLENLRVVHYREQHNNKYLLEHKLSRLEEVKEVHASLVRDDEQYTRLLQRDETGNRINPIIIPALQKELEALQVQREAAALNKQIEKDTRKLLRSLKMKVEKDDEKEVPSKIKEDSELIGEYIINLWKTWKPKLGESSEVIGSVYGFNCCIERVTNSTAEVITSREYSGSNQVMFTNNLYAQHPNGGLKYKFNQGIPNSTNVRLAGRLFLNAVERSGNLLNQYSEEKDRLVIDIKNLSALDIKPFSKENELEELYEQSKKLGQEINAKITENKMQTV